MMILVRAAVKEPLFATLKLDDGFISRSSGGATNITVTTNKLQASCGVHYI